MIPRPQVLHPKSLHVLVIDCRGTPGPQRHYADVSSGLGRRTAEQEFRITGSATWRSRTIRNVLLAKCVASVLSENGSSP